MNLRNLLLVFIVLGPKQVFGFPEMVRHGYVNCTSCHVSPSGGGALTPYGRGLSSNLLSTWGSEREAQVLHGLVDTEKLQDWLLLGGDARGLQFHYENDAIKEGQWINMQAIGEAALRLKTWTIDLAVGKFDSAGTWRAVGSQYYVLNQLSDTISIRAGRFLPQFGLNIPEHISPTRSNLGFGANMQRDAIEAQYAGETAGLVATYSEAPDSIRQDREKAVAVKTEISIVDRFKPGLSFWRGESESFVRQIYSGHAILGFSKSFFLLTEFDLEEKRTKTTGSSTRTFVTYQKLGYEIKKGVVGFLTMDASRSPADDPSTQLLRYGLGLQFFPRPHFEIETVWTRERQPSTSEGDYAWILFHYYI